MFRLIIKILQKTILTLAIAITSIALYAQVKISTGGGNPNASSMLEVESTSKGFLPPRMTSAERDLIASPAEGLVIYNTTTKCLNYRNNNQWLEVCGTCSPQPTIANAGVDQLSINGTSANLAANTPVNGTGLWSIVSGTGGNFAGQPTSTNPTATFTGVAGNSYVLRWTITNSCGNSQDEVNIVYNSPFTPGSQTFVYTGAMQSFTVPNGVSTLSVDIRGAAGGIGQKNGAGGLGGRVQTNLSVTTGQQLFIYVGGKGANFSSGSAGGWNGGGNGTTTGTTGTCNIYGGGGGGGASDIRINGSNISDRVIVAGGGGGGGADGCTANAVRGGNGGGLTGETVNGGTCFGGNNSGSGGSQSAGGDRGLVIGMGANCNPTAGSLFNGGNSVLNPNTCASCVGGAGGGGGYYGGGAGSVASGGGGSSFTGVGTSNVTHTQGFQNGDGQVIISW